MFVVAVPPSNLVSKQIVLALSCMFVPQDGG